MADIHLLDSLFVPDRLDDVQGCQRPLTWPAQVGAAHGQRPGRPARSAGGPGGKSSRMDPGHIDGTSEYGLFHFRPDRWSGGGWSGRGAGRAEDPGGCVWISDAPGGPAVCHRGLGGLSGQGNRRHSRTYRIPQYPHSYV